MVLVEAMAAGLPVVASEIPGYMTVVRNGIEAMTFPPKDVGALVDALGKVLEDADLKRRLAGKRAAESGGVPLGARSSAGAGLLYLVHERSRAGSGSPGVEHALAPCPIHAQTPKSSLSHRPTASRVS